MNEQDSTRFAPEASSSAASFLVRRAACSVLAISLLVVSLFGCVVPLPYRVRFPEGAWEAIPQRSLEEADKVLVLPCWYWNRGGRTGHGPPLILSVETLQEVEKHLEIWTGWELEGAFVHEASRSPYCCGITLIADKGIVTNIDYTFRMSREPGVRGTYQWENPRVAGVGPRMKSALQEILTGKPLSEENLRLVFNYPDGEVLGSPEELEKASAFVGELTADGNDSWDDLADVQAAPDR